jgi:hypothetical protein
MCGYVIRDREIDPSLFNILYRGEQKKGAGGEQNKRDIRIQGARGHIEDALLEF